MANGYVQSLKDLVIRALKPGHSNKQFPNKSSFPSFRDLLVCLIDLLKLFLGMADRLR